MTIPDISLRKSLIPEVFLDCYCVARKRPIRSEKTMSQTNICQVSTHAEIHFILRRARIPTEAGQPDSYNISRVLIREKW